MQHSYCIAVDAMGGDFGPRITVEASLAVLKDHPDLSITLVGDQEQIAPYLPKDANSQLSLVHASSVITADMRVISALREGSDSSMQLALDQLASGSACAVVSAGNTGALMALARRTLGMIQGIDRPAISAAMPTLKGECQVVDLGANLDSSPEMLKQFAVLGRALVRVTTGRDPKIGLLNVGSEETKGNETLREASAQIAELPEVNYIGFVEGADLFVGEADLIVCDGLVGNVALKSSEGVAKLLAHRLRQVFAGSLYSKVIAWLASPMLTALTKSLDSGQRNGALFLGLNGLVVKSHGAANANDFKAALENTLNMLKADLPNQLADQVAQDLNSSP
ncbi:MULTISPECIES: phosphate acyltransferase PlsX [unclassified Marinobacterium]|uniref:phosphate acyltransferase PlsX n=1 Tax=unclassified Marinobacterium TaxID=2644139 RepID=UPI00156897F7